MNNRIKELAEQAEKWIRTTNFEGMPEDEMTYDEIFQKKFAELIVKMCADAADMAYDARCKYVGDYVGEYMGYGEEEGITAWREA